MQSPYKRILVYDLETGGLFSKFNSITEMAIVAIDLETLEIVEEFSVMLEPRMNLRHRELEPIKEAKTIFKNIASKDSETNIKSLNFKDKMITLKSLETLEEEIKEMYEFLHGRKGGDIITYADYLILKETKLKDIIEVYFNHTYNPQALEVTHISKELLVSEGIPPEEAFVQIEAMFKRHTIGNSKPILSGHNIKKFDNPFLEIFFQDNDKNLQLYINQTQMIDTIEWARLKWFELAGYNLGVCANEVGLTLKEAHRALPDTLANAKLLVKMLRNLRGEGSQTSSYQRRKFDFNF